MIPSKIEILIVKYISKSATSSDLDTLTEWIKDPTNKQLFKDYVQTQYVINFNLSNPDSTQLTEKLLHKIRKEKSIFYKYRLKPVYKYAATLILFLGLGYLYQQGFIKSHEEPITNKELIINNENVTLQFDNGNIEVLSEDGQRKIVDDKGNNLGSQNGSEIKYNNKKHLKKIVYNVLTVPYGKRFDLVLSDGTKIKLNAGSSIKYPVQFIENENRKVFLNGEAFFDVAKESNPFIVNVNNLNIRVLGTQFNVSCYPEDTVINTVLVEGSVSLFGDEVYNAETASILNPGFKASWNKTNDDISIDKVDTNIYTGWRKGKLIFKNLQFENIIKKLERHYNVSIVNDNKKLGEQYYNATFDIETIEQVLESFNESYEIKYTIENNKIIIN